MALILGVVIAAVAVAIVTAVLVGMVNESQGGPTEFAQGIAPESIEIKPEYMRCTIRAERSPRPPKNWVDVRIAFFLVNAQQPIAQLTFGEWSREDMSTFEQRLSDLGFDRTASGTSDHMTIGLDRMQRMVIYTR